ncbi:MAG: hypothetical protein PHO31_02015 [Candidatus Pacebacteria bacterium]|nr:hypothetical protein [Candidatus Paceibacterota bacterium]
MEDKLKENNLKIEKIVVDIFQPYFLLIFPIIVACFLVFETIKEAVKWAFIIITLLIAPPISYQYLKRWYFKKQGREVFDFHTMYRDSKKEMAILVALFIIPTCLAAYFLKYPKIIVAVIGALFGVIIVNFVLNFFVKSSFHLAGLFSCITSLWFLVGKYAFFLLPLVPLIAVSKKRLGHHTVDQMVIGSLVGIFVTIFVFWQIVGF